MSAGPQTEDGFTRVANDLLEAIISAPFSKRQYAVVLAVIRKTYGFNKKSDALSMWEIAAMTGIDRANVSRTVAELIGMGVLERHSEGRMSHGQLVPEIGLNKHYDTWKTDANSAQVTDAKTAPVPKRDRCQIGTGDRCQNGTGTDAKLAHEPMPKQHTQKTTKDTTKRQLPKDKGVEYPEWLDQDLWKQFVEFRKAIKKPLTPHAEKLNIADLEKLIAKGEDPREVIEQSIKNGWKGLFEVKGKRQGTGPPSPGNASHPTPTKRITHDDNFDSRTYTGTPESEIDWLHP